MIPVETRDYMVFGDGYAEWDVYPHDASEFVRGDYVRTEDADKAYDALQKTLEDERSDFASFREHHTATEKALDATKADNTALNKELEDSYQYLARLLRHAAPQCEPLPELLGLCTQIDNLLAGMVKPIALRDFVEGVVEGARCGVSSRDPWPNKDAA